MRSRENKTEFYLVNENVEEYIENGAVKYFLLYKRKKRHFVFSHFKKKLKDFILFVPTWLPSFYLFLGRHVQQTLQSKE